MGSTRERGMDISEKPTTSIFKEEVEVACFYKTNASTRIYGVTFMKIVVLTGRHCFPNIKLILKHLFLSVGFNVSTVLEVKCFFDSPDFMKFGEEMLNSYVCLI
jgi:hypothetical protein